MAEKSGVETVVNTTAEASQNFPSLARLSDGRTIVVWEDTRGGENAAILVARFLDADGTPLGTEFVLAAADGANLRRPTVAATDNGFVVAWQAFTSQIDIRLQRFDLTGAPVGEAVTANTNNVGNQISPDIVALTGGGFILSWADLFAGAPDQDGVQARVLGADGQALGDQFLVNTTTQSGQSRPSTAALSDGGFVIAWTDISQEGPDTSSASVRAQRYGTLGAPIGGEFLVNTTTASLQDYPAAAGLSDGGFVIAWLDRSGAYDPDDGIVAQRFDAAGAKVGPEFLVNTKTVDAQSIPAIAALPNGGFVIAWNDDSTGAADDPGGAVRLQEFDAAGAKVGTELLVNTSVLSTQSSPSIGVLEDGSFVVTWQGFSPGIAGADVYSQVFTSAATGFGPPKGTEGDDQLQGGDGPDVIDGLGGSDLIEGFGGDDSLSGGAGNDWLVGEVGDDVLSPGAGINVLEGRDGIDLVSFADRTAGVWVDLSAGSFSDAETWATLRDIEGVIGGGGSDAIYGGGGANRLSGGGGGDVVDGQGGDDRVEGQDGDDWLVGGDGLDRLVGGAGTDELTGGSGADVFDLGASAGWDIARDFDTAEDRIDLAGARFEYTLVRDVNGDGATDTQLTYAGGTLVVLGVSDLTLEGWNALLV